MLSLIMKKYLWIVNLILVALCSLFLAKITSTFIAKSLRVTQSSKTQSIKSARVEPRKLARIDEYKVISARNIFNSEDQVVEKVETVDTPPVQYDENAPAVPTSLNIKLLSTFSVGNGEDKRSSATIVSGQSGNQPEVYRVGDEKQFSPGVEIKRVLSDRVEFLNNSRLEYVELESLGGTKRSSLSNTRSSTSVPTNTQSTNATNSSGGTEKVQVNRSEVDEALKRPDLLFTEINLGPNIVAGTPDGVRVNRIKTSGFFGKMGLQRGDVLMAINGNKITMSNGMQIFQLLKQEANFNLDVVRRGKNMTIEYEIR